MAEVKFTTPPWEVYEPSDNGAILILAGRDKVAGTYRCARAGEERANARLIAAAPDLYAALNHLGAAIAEMAGRGRSLPDDVEDALNEAGTALAKARGETP